MFMNTPQPQPLRVLFLCTGNSARSQMAEAVLNRKGAGRFEAHSAGSHPADRVNPLAIQALQEAGITWRGHAPRGIEGLDQESWDFVITVCDRAREACPVFPGQPILAHWGMPDPAAVIGTEDGRHAAFVEALTLISRRIDLLLALPVEKLERLALELRVRAIGEVGLTADASAGGPGS
jgi:protein-tyrosine-phosphatase